MSQQTPNTDPNAMTAQQVAQFLKDNPRFFYSHPDVLMELELPHGSAGAVSLVERQVGLLRERNIEMRNRLAVLTDNALHNDGLFAATRDTVLALMGCEAIGNLPEVFSRCLEDHYGAEFARLIWLADAAPLLPVGDAIDIEQADAAVALLGDKPARCAAWRRDDMQTLFTDCNSDGSAAIALLEHRGEPLALIAVGASDPARYDSDVGTLFLEYLADIIIRLPIVSGGTP